MKVAVVGCGYVGLVSAVGLAAVGHDVLAVDVDEGRLAALAEGTAPFFEPGLDDALADAIAAGRFRVSSSLADTADGDVVLLCVQTPPTPSGSVELGFVRDASRALARIFAAAPRGRRVVVVRSTVPPGTNDELAALLAREGTTAVVSNPEFLQEGTALQDFLHADRVVLGVREPWARDTVTQLYAPLGAPLMITSPAAAELAKYTSNAFLATLVSFSNEIARLCEATPGVDVEDVLGIVHQDRRLRAPGDGSTPASIVSYLKAGCGYGGSCLPKDMAALIAYGRELGQPVVLLSAVVSVNDGQAARLVAIAERELGSLAGRRIAVLGAAFKAGTDDLRDSQGLHVIAQLVDQGAVPVVFDPLVPTERLRAVLPTQAEVAPSLPDALNNVDAVVVTSIAPEFRDLESMGQIPFVIDGRRDLSPERLATRGYAALGLGPHEGNHVDLTSTRVLVIGATGLVGSVLMRQLEEQGASVRGTYCSRPVPGLEQLDLRDARRVAEVVGGHRPTVVFLTGGFAGVDRAETMPAEARAVNEGGTRAVGEAARTVGARVVFYSTDYVFDGVDGPYGEDDEPTPISAYGRTKLGAERALAAALDDHLIIRTTAVFGWNATSPNFAMQIWQTLGEGVEFQAPGDQVTNPTLADYLAAVTLDLVQGDAKGIVNVVGADRMSRAELARRIAKAFMLDPDLVVPTPTSELGQGAPRPLAGGLRTERMEKLLDTEPMTLDESLKRLRRQWRAATYVSGGPAAPSTAAEQLKQEILERVREYHALAHASAPFEPGRSRVNYSGRTFGAEEVVNAVDASLDFWLTLGPYGDLFERKLAAYTGSRDTVLVNSGSSANLTAVMTLMSPLLPRPLRRGDEVITAAVTFPTTLAPIVQCGLVPVFVDCEIGTYNIDAALIEDAISPRTRAIFVPHTLGNPVALDVICEIAREHDLYLIEDSCDALGATFDGRPVGTFGELGTLSFYPAHQMTMGEGGAVLVNKAVYQRITRSVRDWGRDCWCAPGENNTCGKRFGWQLGELPAGYDHKYVYSHIGFNLKPTDIQAAIGLAQLERVPGFVEARRRNFATLYDSLTQFQDRLILPVTDPRAEPSWFGFPITVRDGVSRQSLVRFLETASIETRTVFGGNILRQPGYRDIEHRVSGNLERSDRIMRDTFFVGVHPGLTPEMIGFVIERFERFFADSRLSKR